MAASQDWKAAGFSAFAGNATLDYRFMKKTVAAGVDDTLADVLEFYKWIEKLRADVANAGIPTAYVPSVQALLTAFFPAMQPGDVWQPGVRVCSLNDAGIVAVESLVDFGTQTPKKEMGIVDGAAALGYIFSVVAPPANIVPTWLTYYLPLAALYSRCLYLAYVMDRISATDPTTVDASGDLPQMSCVMYASANQQNRFIFSSTPAAITGSVPGKAAERFNARPMLDRYRLASVLEPALARQVPTATIPRYSPRRIADLTNKLWSKLSKTAAVTSPILQGEISSLQKTVIDIYEKLPIFGPGTLLALPLQNVRGDHSWGPSMATHLSTIVRDRFLFPQTYDRNNLRQDTKDAYIDLLNTYFVPHIYAKTDTTFALPITDPASQTLVDAAVEPVIDPLWQNVFHTEFLDELDNLYTQEWAKPEHNPFGRCAETYCVAAMLPYYFPNATMDTVRGISLHVPAVGGSDAFATDFGTVQLGQAATKTVYRLPCGNCQQLLPLYGCVMGKTHYDEDIWAVPDKNGKDPV